jgi:membrane-bound lytic murein transglycosylase MltF
MFKCILVNLIGLWLLLAAGPAMPKGTIPLAAHEPWTGDLDGMQERRMIRVLVPYSRTLYFLDGPEQRGIVFETMREFEEAFNKKLGRRHVRVNLVFLPTTRDRLIPALLEGRGDVIAANLTVTPEREAKVDFTRSIGRNVREIVVGHAAAPVIGSLEDLSGRGLFLRRGSSYEAHLGPANAALEAKGLAPIRLIEAPAEFEAEDVLEMVNAGLVEYTVVDEYLARFWAQIFDDIRLFDGVALSEGNDIAFAIRKGSPLLKAELDAFIGDHRKGTAFGNILFRKYFQNTRFALNATSEAERRKLLDLVQLFRTYGDRYGLDWLLVAAQGYQESRLDHSVVSPVGAIGIMQVMPATGADMGVGDIRELENNLHAGVKYLRFLIDNFFDDASIEPLDRMLFAIASYNAGPGRIRAFRREAGERGLDANRWFNHVEHIAAERIGRETVQYVSNIYKYFIAYKLIKEQGLLTLPGAGSG